MLIKSGAAEFVQLFLSSYVTQSEVQEPVTSLWRCVQKLQDGEVKRFSLVMISAHNTYFHRDNLGR